MVSIGAGDALSVVIEFPTASMEDKKCVGLGTFTESEAGRNRERRYESATPQEAVRWRTETNSSEPGSAFDTNAGCLRSRLEGEGE